METFALLGGFLFVAAIGYLAVSRLGSFLDRGGFAPYWDEEEERLDECAPKEPAHADARDRQGSCGDSDSSV